VFHTPFQSSPLDLLTSSPITLVSSSIPSVALSEREGVNSVGMSYLNVPLRKENRKFQGFYASRQAIIENNLSKITNMSPHQLASLVESSYWQHHGYAVKGFDWRSGKHSPLGLLQVCIILRQMSNIKRMHILHNEENNSVIYLFPLPYFSRLTGCCCMCWRSHPSCYIQDISIRPS